VIGTGVDGMLPVTDGLVQEAKRRGIELLMVPTVTALKELERDPAETNSILHVTC
jgi:hypothetical protein